MKAKKPEYNLFHQVALSMAAIEASMRWYVQASEEKNGGMTT